MWLIIVIALLSLLTEISTSNAILAGIKQGNNCFNQSANVYLLFHNDSAEFQKK